MIKTINGIRVLGNLAMGPTFSQVFPVSRLYTQVQNEEEWKDITFKEFDYYKNYKDVVSFLADEYSTFHHGRRSLPVDNLLKMFLINLYKKDKITAKVTLNKVTFKVGDKSYSYPKTKFLVSDKLRSLYSVDQYTEDLPPWLIDTEVIYEGELEGFISLLDFNKYFNDDFSEHTLESWRKEELYYSMGVRSIRYFDDYSLDLMDYIMSVAKDRQRTPLMNFINKELRDDPRYRKESPAFLSLQRKSNQSIYVIEDTCYNRFISSIGVEVLTNVSYYDYRLLYLLKTSHKNITKEERKGFASYISNLPTSFFPRVTLPSYSFNINRKDLFEGILSEYRTGSSSSSSSYETTSLLLDEVIRVSVKSSKIEPADFLMRKFIASQTRDYYRPFRLKVSIVKLICKHFKISGKEFLELYGLDADAQLQNRKEIKSIPLQ